MDETVRSLLTVFMAQIDSAMTISDILSQHAGDDEITPDSLIIGLIYRLMVPMKDDELQQAIKNGEEMVKSIDEFEEESDDDGDESLLEIPEESRNIKTNSCNCDICMTARVCKLNYASYEAPDPLAEKFQNAIKHACDKHKLIV